MQRMQRTRTWDLRTLAKQNEKKTRAFFGGPHTPAVFPPSLPCLGEAVGNGGGRPLLRAAAARLGLTLDTYPHPHSFGVLGAIHAWTSTKGDCL